MPAPVHEVTGDEDGVRVAAATAQVRAPWVLTSAPLPGDEAPQSKAALWQHFLGAVVGTDGADIDHDRAVLMDLRVPQLPRGTGFGYLLPMGDGTVLAEYTVLAPGPADADLMRDGWTPTCTPSASHRRRRCARRRGRSR